MTNTSNTIPPDFLLRACAAVVTPANPLHSSEIVEFGRADMVAQPDRIGIDEPQSYVYRTASGELPAPETIAV